MAETNKAVTAEQLSKARERIAQYQGRVSTGGIINGHIVILDDDGTVIALGNNDNGQCNVSDWRDIAALTAGSWHTAGLKKNGTVVAVGLNSHDQCDVSDWRDIVEVAANSWHTVGLKKNGTVVSAGLNSSSTYDVSDWRDIAAIAAGSWHMVGLKADGTLVAVGKNDYGQCNVSGWSDIAAVTAGSWHTVGLKADGTLVAVGSNECGQCDISGWRDIAAIAVGRRHTVGLKADGTLVAAGRINDKVNWSDLLNWHDIAAIAADGWHTLGLKADGTLVAVGWGFNGEYTVSQLRQRQAEDAAKKAAGTIHDKWNSKFKKKRILSLNGQKYFICRGIPTPSPERSIYLFGTLGEAPDYSLWNICYKDDDHFTAWPYEGEESFELTQYLLEEFVEHAFDDD